MKSCNRTKQEFGTRLRVYLGLAFLFFCLGMSGQEAECSRIALSKDRYALSDTMDVSVGMEGTVSAGCFVDLISPFGEVIAQKRTSDGKVRIPVLLTWECGFYELRVYENATSPVLATRVVPILADETTDSIPMWDAALSASPTYPAWLREFMASGNGNFQGLLLTKKGKALEKEGICVDLQGVDEDGMLVWEGTAISGKHGEFSLSVPKDKMHGMTLFFKNKRGKQLTYNCVVLPDGKDATLSDVYRQECLQTARRLNLNVYEKSVDDRRYYFYDMRREALDSYILAGRVPLLGDWFIGHPQYAEAMRKEHRAVGWNGKFFSMWPAKRVKVKDNRERLHSLHGDQASSYYNPHNSADYSKNYVGSQVLSFPPVVINIPLYMEHEGAPRLWISQILSLVVLAGHDNQKLVPENREYMKKYDPMMVYFK